MKTVNISKTFSDVFSGGLGFGKKIAILAFMLGMLFLSAPLASSQTEESTPPCAEEPCGSPPASEPTSNETVIVTGDAQSDVTIENNANTSEVAAEEESAPPAASESNLAADPSGDTNLTVENNSSAEVATEATSTAATGENNADENTGSAVIATGDSNASANIINIVNSTFTGSNGLIALLNIFASLLGDLDFRDAGFLSSSCPDCSIFSGDLSVNNQNAAVIQNDVVVRAMTGENSASGNTGNGIIATGDANAAANVLNIVNTNVVGSNYLLLVLNNFGSWSGDLVLPSKYLFPECCGDNGGGVSVNNNNDASIENNVSGSAETGSNEANGNGSGIIVTGQANAINNAVTQANTNIFGSDSVLIAFRFLGDWTGNVFSAPDGFSWMESGGGLVLIGDPSNSLAASSDGSGGSVNINNSNAAAIRNNITALALTGANRVNGNGGTGAILTGNANSATNVVNIVNTNVFGRNWILALVNIFGNWNGDIAFGRPDLWVGESASEIPREAVPGNKFTYTLTVINNGDTDATNVLLHDDFDERYLNPVAHSGGVRTDRGVEWNIGTLKPGEVKAISYEVEIKDNLPAGATFLSNTANVGAFETDNFSEDNVERTTILINRKREINFSSSALPDFRISKINGATSGTARPGESVGYKIILKNVGGGRGYDSKVIDKLYYGTGAEPINVREWPLETVYDSEEISITYTLEISPSAKPGVYRNVAKFSAKDELGVDRYFVIAENSIEVLPPEPPASPDASQGGPPAESVTQEPVSVEREIKEVVSMVSEYVSEAAEVADETISVPEDTDKVVIEEAQKTGMFRNLLALAYFNFNRIWQWFATTAAGILAAIYLKLYG